MANPFIQYLNDTRGELRHVAWPTRTQTVIYALLVAAISIGVALYLGLFDLFFTSSLGRALSALPQNPSAAQQQTATNTSPITVTKQTGTTSSVPVAPAQAPAKLPSL